MKERYNFYHNAPSSFKRYKDMGVLMQLNILSIMGYYGREVKRTAQSLINNNYYDLAATDLHHDKHLEALTLAVKSGELYTRIGTYPFKNRGLF
jgi:protein-tyrosine phosphatase